MSRLFTFRSRSSWLALFAVAALYLGLSALTAWASHGTTPHVSIDDVTEPEGDSGTTAFEFTVSLDAPPMQDVEVDFITSDNTATTADGDYQSNAGTVTFSSLMLEQSKTITIQVEGDTFDESDESFRVVLVEARDAHITDDVGLGTIENDDDPHVTIDDPSVVEGDAGTSDLTFTVALSNAPNETITVDYATADASATIADGDYADTSGTLTWSAGDGTARTVTVPVNGDTVDEPDEDLTVGLTVTGGSTGSVDGEGTGTIVNDDDPTISIDDVTVLEGDSGTVDAVFTVTLSHASDVDVTVDYDTSDDTATASPDLMPNTGDYESTSGSVTFSGGSIEETVTVPVNGDTVDEADEDFFVDLSNAMGGASIDDGRGVGTIVNDDARVSIDDVSVAEGDSGAKTAMFTVSLSRASSSGQVSVDYATADDTATTGDGDYVGTSGTLTWAQGEAGDKTVEVTVNGDTADEPDEDFFVDLSNISGDAKIGDGQGVGTIVNDDDPTISIDDVTVLEGDSGTVDAVFTVALSHASDVDVTVDYGTTDDSAEDENGDGDYQSASNTLTFSSATNETSKTVTILVNGDTVDEADEDFFVDLSNAMGGATISDGRGVGTITDDDEPAISVDDPSVTEGDAGTADLIFTVTLDIAGDETVTVDYATADDSATTADNDYEAVTGTLTFTPGDTSEQVTVTVNGDDDVEGDETLFLNLSNPTGGATIADGQGVGTIAEDAGEGPTLSIGDVTVTEGDTGTVDATFTVSLSGRSDQPVTFDWESGNGTATTADGDYVSSGNTGETIPAGETSTTVTVPVNGDEVDEADEYFFVFVTSVNGANAGDTTGRGDILNDDDPSVSIDDVSVTEGDSGTATATFTVSLSNESDEDVTVDYTTVDGTAMVADGDYDAASGTLTFTGSETSQTIDVTVNGDVRDEPDEVFTVELSNVTGGASISDGTGQGTITDDDDAPGISVDDPSVAEGDSGTTTLDFTVTLSEASGKTVTVDYATVDGTAEDENGDGDYDAASDTLTFAPGETSKTVPVTVNGDAVDEADETFDLNLSNPSNATITDGTGTGTITNDDDPPSISIDDPSVLEGDSGTRPLEFTVTLSEASGKTVTVDYATVDGTAQDETGDGDYDAASGTLTFAPGETSKTVPVTVNGDTVDEGDETFDVNLSNASNATIAEGTGTGTILNDDDPSVSIDDVSVTEGDSGTATATFTVSLSNESDEDVTVDYTTVDGTATVADGDYDAASGTLTFAPGETSKTVPVTVNGDTVDEGDETFDVNLSNPSNSTITGGTGTATIVDDDETVTPDPDSDDDGVADENDNCPDVANEGQADADGDGSGDACDPDYEATDVDTTDRPDSTQQRGERVCMTFQVEDDAGQPVEGAELVMQLSGANSEENISVGCGFTAQSTESDTTDASGEATFSYVGNDEGRDTIFAFVDRDGDGQWDSGEPFSSPFSITWESQQTGDDGTTHRLAGADRWKTAIDISQDAYPGSDSVSTVVLARGDSPDGYADALAGAPLAASLDAPLLITAPGVLLDDVAAEIDRVLADGGEVIMLGQTAALSSDVEQAIVAMGYDARRIGGADRFETSTMIADEVDATPDQILIARAFDFPDALTAGAAASADTGRVVILGSAGGRHSATEAYLNEHPGAQRYAIGGQMAAVYPEATPVFGADRFKTATAVADRFFTDPISAGIARSHDFPDSLTGGPYVGTRGGPMLLTPDAAFVAGSGEELRAETRGYLCDNSASIEDAFVFGGTAAIADATRTEIGQAIRGEDC